MDRRVALVTGASTGIGAAFARAPRCSRREPRAGRPQRAAARGARETRSRPTTASRSRCSRPTWNPRTASTASRSACETRIVGSTSSSTTPGSLTTGAFHELPVDGELSEIRLNVVALVRLTHAALGPMVERGHGGVINVSSVAAYQPTPLTATYGATKAFVSSFTNAIYEELHGTGVKAMVLAPGFTHTEIHDRAEIDEVTLPKFVWQMPDEVVAVALKAYDKGRAVCIPGAANAVTAAFSGSLPAGITRKVANRVMRRAF